ncbi:MAG: hypothetical protein Q7R60_01595 [bacterium]|nr:hypothetical protein [bacterium]
MSEFDFTKATAKDVLGREHDIDDGIVNEILKNDAKLEEHRRLIADLEAEGSALEAHLGESGLKELRRLRTPTGGV